MSLTHDVIYGNLLENNVPPPNTPRATIRIPGSFHGTATPFSISEEMLSKHILLVGGTGSGKTNLFYHIVRQLKHKLSPNDVMLVFDSKGDFYNKFYTAGDIVIGNSVQYRKASAKWNIYREIIIDGMDNVSVTQNTQEICKSLFADRIDGKSSNPFFPNAARDLLASVIISLVRNGVSFNNKDLKDTLDLSSIDDLRSMLAAHKDLASVASYIGSKAGSQAQGVLSEMYSVTRDVLTGVFADVGEFSMRQFIRRKGGKAAFLEYDLAIGDALSPIYTLLFDLSLKEALGRTATQGNVYLIADELKLLPNLRHLEDGINFGRSLGVKILAGLQSIDQLSANYGNEAKARNAVTGFSSIFAFRSNDFNTREYISKLFGRNMILETFEEANGNRHYEKREGYMVEDWDLAELHVGEAIVGLPSVPPFQYQFDLFKDEGQRMSLFGSTFNIMGGLFRGTMSASLWTGNAIYTALRNAKTKKEIRAVYRNAMETNCQNRSVGVLSSVDKQQLLLSTCDPGDNDIIEVTSQSATPAIDYIWGESRNPEGAVVSGGSNDVRVRALMPFVHKCQQESIPLVCLHNGNRGLETMIQSHCIACELVSRNQRYFDVFRGMPVDDMAYLLYETMPDDITNPSAEALLRALLEIVLRTQGTVTFHKLASFPLQDLKNTLDTLQNNGGVTAVEYHDINRNYMAGSPEIGTVRIFLNKLNRQAEGIYGKPSSNACNIKKMLNFNGIVGLDVGGVNHDLILSLVINYLMMLQSQGRNFSILLDDIPISRFPEISDLLRGQTYAISHNDFISSLFGGTNRGDDLFSEITGGIGTLVLFKHMSGTSCQKWSEHLGKYHKIRIQCNISQNRSFMNSGDQRGISVDETDEPRVRAETLGKLQGSMACINNTNGILFAEVQLLD